MHQSAMSPTYMLSCARHGLPDDTTLEIDDFYFANGVYTDMWHGSLQGKAVAVKVWRGGSLSLASREHFSKRLAIVLDRWKCLRHANIVPFLGLDIKSGHLPSLILPCYENGHVISYLAENPSADIPSLVEGVAAALYYLHTRGPPIIHGDVKGSNVLITTDGQPCLSDIGINNIPFPTDWALSNHDDARWMAPEIMDPAPDVTTDGEISPITKASDIYSFGMTMLEMYTRKLPFSHRRFCGGVVFDVVSGIRPPRPTKSAAPQLMDDVWELMQKCWVHDPTMRLPMNTVYPSLSLMNQVSHIDTERSV